jgi:hypothetical protein
MSEVLIHLKLDNYLAQWLINESGGVPVVFKKHSVENDILHCNLKERPLFGRKDKPGDGKLPIALPYFKDRDPRKYCFLSKPARLALAECIRSRFVLELWKDLHRFGNIGKRKQDLIWAWMDAHGIEMTETNWNTIAKIYKRKRDIYRKKKQREKVKKS